MSAQTDLHCDGPGCEETLVNAIDDEPEAKGWLALDVPDSLGEPRTFDFCSMNCLSEWSRLEAMLP